MGKRIPLSQRLGLRPRPEPFEGVPNHLARALGEWFVRWTENQPWLVKKIALRIGYAYRPQGGYMGPSEAVSFLMDLDGQPGGQVILLDAIDQVLGFPEALEAIRRGRHSWSSYAAWEELDQVLEDGESAWRVGPDRDQLVRRVDDAVQQVADAAIQNASESAAAHLTAAWNAVYGRHPDPNRAYEEAVFAVEDAVTPTATPKDPKASLGKAIAHIKATQGKWELAGGASIDGVLEVLDQLWARHPRHAANARRVDQSEAEAAVHTAAYLVHLFSRSLIRRR